MTGGRVMARRTRPTCSMSYCRSSRKPRAYHTGPDFIELDMKATPRSVSITTARTRRFPTDMQAQFAAMNCIADASA